MEIVQNDMFIQLTYFLCAEFEFLTVHRALCGFHPLYKTEKFQSLPQKVCRQLTVEEVLQC